MNKLAKIIVAALGTGLLAFMVISGLNLGEGFRQGKEMAKKQIKHI